MQLRPETPADQPGVRAVHLAAFEGPDEADLVNRLRGHTFPYVSLVAVDKGRIVGHILFTPVLLPGHPRARLMGLAPMAVLPDYQRSGVGSALVEAGLDAAQARQGEAQGAGPVFVGLVTAAAVGGRVFDLPFHRLAGPDLPLPDEVLGGHGVELLVVKADKGTPVLIRDIARVELVPDERRGLTELNGEGEVVSGIAMARYGQNALEVIHNLKDKIAEIGPGLPEGVSIQPVYDRSELIERAIADARAQGRRGLVLTCKDRLVHYYAKFGFVSEGVSESTHGGVVWYQMRLTF
mgnify:CR=1 FL=1